MVRTLDNLISRMEFRIDPQTRAHLEELARARSIDLSSMIRLIINERWQADQKDLK